MLLTFDALMERLANPKNSMRENKTSHEDIQLEVRKLQQGRKAGQPNYSEEMRVSVGALARLQGPTIAAQESGMTQGNASYLKRAYSSNLEKSQELNRKINEHLATKVDSARDLALDKLIASITHIDDEKLKDMKPQRLASVAKDLSAVVDKVSADRRDTGNFRVVINTVGQKDDSDYPTVEISM